MRFWLLLEAISEPFVWLDDRPGCVYRLLTMNRISWIDDEA